jgi:TonB family protein
MAVVLGFLIAVVLHAAFLLFGGLLIPQAKPDQGTLQKVELFSQDEVEQAKKEEQKEEEKAESDEEIKVEDEEAPDAAEIIRSLEMTPAATPKLDAASLSAIEDALRGIGSSGSFAQSVSFNSEGRLWGTGSSAVGAGNTLDDAFSLAEIDQKPRAIFQTSPQFPSEMRSKKVEGQVTLIFVVDASGKVADARVEKSSHPAFEKPALDAVRQWKFEPGVKGGQRVACKMRVPIRFQPPA